MPDRTSDTDEILARITEIARKALQAQTDAARQSFNLGRAALNSGADPVTTGRAWVEAAVRESERYWKEATALGIDMSAQLVPLGGRGMARVLADTQAAVHQGQAATRRAGQAEEDEAPPTGTDSRDRDSPAADSPGRKSADPLHVSVTLHGAVGERATGTVVLANPHARARRVTLTAGELSGPSDPVVGLSLRIDPQSVTIPGRAEQSIALEVDLPADVAVSGARYTGVVEVSGGVAAVVDVAVEVA